MHAFATGRIDGYFDNNVPEEFFKLLALYISSNTLSLLPWAVQFGQDQIETMTLQAASILEAFDDFSLTVPKWYSRTKEDLTFMKADHGRS